MGDPQTAYLSGHTSSISRADLSTLLSPLRHPLRESLFYKGFLLLRKIRCLRKVRPGTERYRELYRISKPDDKAILTVDLLVVTPIFEDVWKDKQQFEWIGKTLSVVSLAGLAKMKLLGGRHQDLADLENLGLEVEIEAQGHQTQGKEKD